MPAIIPIMIGAMGLMAGRSMSSKKPTAATPASPGGFTGITSTAVNRALAPPPTTAASGLVPPTPPTTAATASDSTAAAGTAARKRRRGYPGTGPRYGTPGAPILGGTPTMSPTSLLGY